jgi:hypothetical protein
MVGQGRSPTIRLLVLFVLTFSLSSFAEISNPRFMISSVHADTLNCGGPGPGPLRMCPGTQWYPAGPSIDKLQMNIYTDEVSEYQNGLQGGQIDLTDWTVPATLSSAIAATGSGLFLSDANSEFGMFDIDFNHAQSFFGIADHFGQDGFTTTNAAINFRQGIAHLIDKAAFITAAPTIAGKANVLDNALPPGQGILHSGLTFNAQNPPSPSTCAPSTTQACATGTATGSYTTTAVDANGVSSSVTVGGVCGWDLLSAQHVTAGQICQSAYKYGSDSSTNGIVNAASTNPDFCDAAAHWQAAGLGTGVSTVDCHLLGFAPLAGGASSIIFVIRSDSPPLLLLGDTLAARMCELTNGAGTTTCSQITVSHQTIVQALSTVFATRSVLLDWHMYTASWRLGSQFDQLFALYNNRFSSSGCVSSQPNVAFGADYVYWCNASYDAATNNLEFANSYSVAVQQAQVAMDVFGSHVATIPIWSGAIQFGYVIGWIGVSNAVGVGPPNYLTLLNGWNKTPVVNGTLRWGFKQGTVNLNPYLFTTFSEANVVHEVYDSLLAADAYSPSTLFGWMVNSFVQVNPTDIRMVLKPDMFWHDGTRVTAGDVKFSLLSYQQTGGPVASSVSNVNDVSIISSPPGQYSIFDIMLLHPSPFALFDIGSVPIVPQHIWAVDKVNPCTVKGSSACTLDTTLLSGSASDPIVNHTFIGSGPFRCVDLVSGQVGGGCTQTAAGGPGTQVVDVGGQIILQRTGFGFAGTDPLHSYFRGSAQWKLWQWADSANIGTVDVVHDLAAVEACAGKPATTTGCGHFDTPAATITCTSTAGSCNAGSLSLGGNNGGTISGTEVSQVETNALQTWNPGVSGYSSFTGALPLTGTVYEGGISYCQFPLPSGATCP